MSLRAQIVRGGMYLAVREGIGVFLGIAGMLILTRRIGPEAFGVYAAALGILTYAQNLFQWGIGVFLIRHVGDESDALYDQAFTLLALLALCGTASTLALLPILSAWMHVPGLRAVAGTLFPGLFPLLLSAVPLAILERRLDYRRVAIGELLGQVAFYAAALPLAVLFDAGVWAPVVGWWLQQLTLVVFYFVTSEYRPRPVWSNALVREMTSYGLGFSASLWVWQLRNLVNPLIVGRFAGASGIGTVALAIRIVEALSFVKTATWRISIAALGRMQHDIARLLRAIGEGMTLQVLALGPLLVGFAIVGPRLLPLLFGAKWAPAMVVYPYVAIGYLCNAMFSLHASGLYVYKRNWFVAFFHAVHIVLFSAAAFLFVRSYGVVGYGWAELAALPAYVVLVNGTALHLGRTRYSDALLWLALLLLPLGLAAADYFYAALIACAIIPLPLVRRAVRQQFRDILRATLHRAPAASDSAA